MLEARNIWDLIVRRAEETPGRDMAVDEAGRRLTFAAYRDRCERAAAGLVDTEGDAHAARKCFVATTIEFELFWELIKTWDNVPLLVVSARNAYGYAEWLIKRYGPGINVRFVDLEGKTLESMVKRRSSRLRLYLLIENPWHMTMTSGSC